jgi:hypothetical protein
MVKGWSVKAILDDYSDGGVSAKRSGRRCLGAR